jgi:hypothetical protein
MVNIDFWITVAQVSATFVGLVFVGFSIYLTGIRRAVDEVKTELGLEEQSTRVMIVSVLSNLSFFILPLITSLALIAQQRWPDDISITVYFFWFTCALLLCTLLWGRYSSTTRQQMKLVLSERLGKGMHLRVRSCWWLYLLVLAHAGLLWLILTKPFDREAFLRAILQATTYASIVSGLACGIWDLMLFDVDNVLFRVSEKMRDRIKDLNRGLQSQMQHVRFLYQKYETGLRSPKYEEELNRVKEDPHVSAVLDTAHIREHAKAEQDAIHSSYKELCEQIPANCEEADLIQRIRAKGEIITYADLRILKEESEILFKDIGWLNEKLTGKLETFRERGIVTNEAG